MSLLGFDKTWRVRSLENNIALDLQLFPIFRVSNNDSIMETNWKSNHGEDHCLDFQNSSIPSGY